MAIKRKRLIPVVTVAVIVILLVVMILTIVIPYIHHTRVTSPLGPDIQDFTALQLGEVKRGVGGDYWADIVLGKRNFAEISARKIVDNHLNNPGGVGVFDVNADGKREMFIWDSGNNRVLVADYDECSADPAACKAKFVIGQPSAIDYGACNGNSAGITYPIPRASTSKSICGTQEFTHTTLEDKTFSYMALDKNKRLWIADLHNNRILGFDNPLANNPAANITIGQESFTANLCNQGNSLPSNRSLCTSKGAIAAIAFDSKDNLWVVDSGNNRVLLFPRQSNGQVSKTAIKVFGQDGFNTRVSGDHTSRMNIPGSIAIDENDNAYIGELENKRILKISQDTITQLYKAEREVNSMAYDVGSRTLFIGQQDKILRIDAKTGDMTEEFQVEDWFGGQMSLLPGPESQNPQVVFTNYRNGGQRVMTYTKSQGETYAKSKEFFGGGYNLTSADRFEQGGWQGVALAGDKLFVTDGRLMFWNVKYNSSLQPIIRNGQAPTGYLGDAASSISIPDPIYRQMTTDSAGNLYVTRRDTIEVFTAASLAGNPSGKKANFELKSLKTIGNEDVVLLDPVDVSVSPDGSVLWVSEPGNHRVLRIKNPLSVDRVVDVVLGQKRIANNPRLDDGFDPDFSGSLPNMCNQGLQRTPSLDPNTNPDMSMLCFPGGIQLDRKGNLFVSDHMQESAGNFRVLMYSSDSISSYFNNPANEKKTLIGLQASKEFPRVGDPDIQASEFARLIDPRPVIESNKNSNAKFKPAFNSQNFMVVGNNPYSGRRFLEVYSKPDFFDSSDPDAIANAVPDASMYDFMGWATGMTFDKHDNLYVNDANRGRLLIFFRPTFNEFKYDGELCGKLDSDNDGLITIADMSNLVGKIGVLCKDAQYDFTGCGPIDTNLDRKITEADYEKVRDIFGQKCPTDSAEYMICGELDYNGDGRINILDFSGMVASIGRRCLNTSYVAKTSCGKLDSDNNNLISSSDVFQIMAKFGQACTEL